MYSGWFAIADYLTQIIWQYTSCSLNSEKVRFNLERCKNFIERIFRTNMCYHYNIFNILIRSQSEYITKLQIQFIETNIQHLQQRKQVEKVERFCSFVEVPSQRTISSISREDNLVSWTADTREPNISPTPLFREISWCTS